MLLTSNLRTFIVAGLTLAAASYAVEVPTRQKFNLPADTAEKSLKRFSEQSGRSVMFATDKVQDVRTNPVEGELTASEALNRLLAGTPLHAIPETQTGGFAVARDAAKLKDTNGTSDPEGGPDDHRRSGAAKKKVLATPQLPQKT